MLGYLSARTLSVPRNKSFSRECSSRKTVSFEEQMMSKDKLSEHTIGPNGGYCVHYNSNLPKMNLQYSSFCWTRAGAPENRTPRPDRNRVRPEYEIRAVNLFMVAFLQLTKYKMSLRPRNRTPNPELHGQVQTEWDQSTRLELWICSWSLFFSSLNTGCASGREKNGKAYKKTRKLRKGLVIANQFWYIYFTGI